MREQVELRPMGGMIFSERHSQARTKPNIKNCCSRIEVTRPQHRHSEDAEWALELLSAIIHLFAIRIHVIKILNFFTY